MLERGIDYVAVGDPRTRCPNCGRAVRFTHISEWDELSLMGRLLRFASIAVTAFIYGGVPTFLAYMFLFVGDDTSNVSGLGLFLGWSSGFAVVSAFLVWRLCCDIRESRKRTSVRRRQ